MRKLYTVLFFLVASLGLNAQQYGNEWIVYSQQYFSIKVYQDGIYRIDSTTLANAGINLSSVDPRSFQLFGRERQQAIFISGESDGVFNGTDYIEFLGFKNDGWLDSLVYNGTDAMPDLYYSLYNDTATYYLTVNGLTTNLRARSFSDTTFSLYSPAPYYTTHSYVKYANEYYVGPQLEGASQSRFVYGEGWYSDRYNGISGGNTFASIVQTPSTYVGPGAPDAEITAVCASNSNANPPDTSTVNHHMRIEYGSSSTLLLDTIFYAYGMVKKKFTVPAGSLSSPTTIYYRIIDDLDVATDYFNVASSTIVYPHIPDFNGLTDDRFKVDYNSLEPYTRYDIANYGGVSPLVYMVGDSVWRTTGQLTGSTLQLLVPNDASTKPVTCYTFGSVNNVTSLIPINGTGYFTDYSTVTLDSAYIILTHKKLLTQAQQYAAYRSSPAGGSYQTIVVPITELYDQFSAGVHKHSLAARRFCNFAINNWPSKPSYLFIIGKSVREASEGFLLGSSYGTRKDWEIYEKSLVPSYGYPCSDNRITAGLDGTWLEPAIPTGRLSATDTFQVIDYLGKMIEYEQAQQNPIYTKEEKDWMKHVLEFGGGANVWEQNLFKSYLAIYKNTLEDVNFAGTVDTFYKTSSDPIDPVDFQEVNNRINAGVSMMIFFGHASITGFDQNLDDVNNWQNQGRYPLLIGNACYTGDIHQPYALSVSEGFTLVPDKGVIGFLSTVKQGFVNELYRYSNELTLDISKFNYGNTIGEHIQQSVKINQMALSIGVDSLNAIPGEEVYTGMTLHGDPALRVNTHPLPELVIETSDAFIEPTNITLADDSMDVNLIIHNLGRGTDSTFKAVLTRTFPNGNGDSTYTILVNGMNYQETIVFRIPVYHTIAFGSNHFSLSIDLDDNVVPEIYDDINNNQIEFDYVISANAIFPVYPYNFAIVPDSVVTFQASTVNPLSATTSYRFELDTTDAFNSPFKRYIVVNSVGGVVTVPGSSWLLQSTGAPSPLVHTDSMVYYWRVSPDSSTFIWQESSYQYIKGKEGWGQAHFYQFKNNDFSHLIYNKPAQVWDFETLNDIVTIETIAFPTAGETKYNAWYINGDPQEYDGTLPNSTFYPGLLYVGVIDPFDPEPWHTYDGYFTDSSFTNIKNYGQFNCLPCGTGYGRPRGEYYFGFRQSVATEMDAFYNLIENEIPCGHYFVIWTFMCANFGEWDSHSPEIYTLFQNLGVSGLNPGAMGANRTLMVMGRKCDTASYKFMFGDSVHTGVKQVLVDTLNGTLPGAMESGLIGPAYNWNTLYWKQHALEPVTGDSTVLSLYGIKLDGSETKLFDTLYTNYDSVINLNSLVDAAVYPYLRLRARTVDNITLTPAYFERWQVIYTPAPEAALNPSDGFYLSGVTTDTLPEGEEFRFAMAIKNISPYHMDSMLVHYWVEDANRVRHYLTYARQDSLKSGELLLDTITVPTLNYPGQNYLWIEANPIPIPPVISGAYDQLEQYHFNNIARIPFTVSEDNENPLLDVTFDGRHILNGDIVSARPFVVMTLDDENEFLIMDQPEDTSRFLVYLTNPAGTEKRIYFVQGGVEQLKFIPAGSDNKCKIEWNAEFKEDGFYALRVKAWDKSDNKSGNGHNGEGYKIQFEVVLKQTITHVMNYPNPFSTKTHFVFTLTGEAPPEFMKIQIFTVSGKVVREIMIDELGPLYIGKNVTEYAWDGRDEFGDQLANGVYFYRVITKDSGLKDVEMRESGADPYFRKEFGKMYLMR